MFQKKGGIWGLGVLEYVAEGRVPSVFRGSGWERWKVLAALALFRFREECVHQCGKDFAIRVLRGGSELLGEDSRPVWVLERRLERMILGNMGKGRLHPQIPKEEASGALWLIRSEADRRARRCTPCRFFHTQRQGREYPARPRG